MSFGIGQEWHGQAEKLFLQFSPGEIDAGDNVRPLITAANLELAIIVFCQHKKIIGLAEHIAEFEKTEVLFAFEAHGDRFGSEHFIH